jgi:hypothetical protein
MPATCTVSSNVDLVTLPSPSLSTCSSAFAFLLASSVQACLYLFDQPHQANTRATIRLTPCASRSSSASQSAAAYTTGTQSIRVQQERRDITSQLRPHLDRDIHGPLLISTLPACKKRQSSSATHANGMHAAEELFTNSIKTQSVLSGSRTCEVDRVGFRAQQLRETNISKRSLGSPLQESHWHVVLDQRRPNHMVD